MPTQPSGPRKRRRFSAEHRLRILLEADSCTRRGDLVALLRREGLHSSTLWAWRRRRDRAVETALQTLPTGDRPRQADAVENARLSKLNHRLTGELERARAVITVQARVIRSLVGERPKREGLDLITFAVDELSPLVGTLAACRALGAGRATVYRRRAASAR